jgi:hypothetical protein
MRDHVLHRLLRNALTLCMAAPVSSIGACGGAVDETSTAPDGGTADAVAGDAKPADGGHPDASLTCAGQSCGGACAAGCTLSTSCENGVLACACACPPQPEASVVDVLEPDATDPCHPSTFLCPYYMPFSCLDSAVPDASSLSSAECAVLCGFPNNGGGFCYVGSDSAGQPAVECYAQCGVGRRARELGRAPRKRGSAVGRYLAAAARLEAASVHSFRRLRRELEEHDAPTALRRAAEHAGHDEVRHARDTSRLALLHGVTPRMPRGRLRPRPSLETMAVENAAEGCVRETYGALLAMFQAQKAGDPAVGRLMRGIAADEVRHAALSWRVGRWAEGRLAPAARARVDRAKRAAVRELFAEIAREPPPALVTRVGLPDAKTAQRLLLAMLGQLEATAAADHA